MTLDPRDLEELDKRGYQVIEALPVQLFDGLPQRNPCGKGECQDLAGMDSGQALWQGPWLQRTAVVMTGKGVCLSRLDDHSGGKGGRHDQDHKLH